MQWLRWNWVGLIVAIASGVVAGLIALHVYVTYPSLIYSTFPSIGEATKIETFISSVLAVAAVASLVTAWLKIKASQTLSVIELRNEYGSAKMMYAIEYLWDFYRKDCNSNEKELLKKFRDRYEEEKGCKKTLTETLNYQRRLVKIYYENLAVYLERGAIPRHAFNDFWNKESLEIIPKIVYPLCVELNLILNEGRKVPEEIYPDKHVPLKLYFKIPECKKVTYENGSERSKKEYRQHWEGYIKSKAQKREEKNSNPNRITFVWLLAQGVFNKLRGKNKKT